MSPLDNLRSLLPFKAHIIKNLPFSQEECAQRIQRMKAQDDLISGYVNQFGKSSHQIYLSIERIASSRGIKSPYDTVIARGTLKNDPINDGTLLDMRVEFGLSYWAAILFCAIAWVLIVFLKPSLLLWCSICVLIIVGFATWQQFKDRDMVVERVLSALEDRPLSIEQHSADNTHT